MHPRVARQHPALRQGVGDSVVNTQLTATGRSAAPRSSAVLSPGRHLGSLNSGLSTSALWSLRVMQWRRRRVSCLGEGRRPELSPLAISLRACTVGYYGSAGTCTTVGRLQVAMVHVYTVKPSTHGGVACTSSEWCSHNHDRLFQVEVEGEVVQERTAHRRQRGGASEKQNTVLMHSFSAEEPLGPRLWAGLQSLPPSWWPVPPGPCAGAAVRRRAVCPLRRGSVSVEDDPHRRSPLSG